MPTVESFYPSNEQTGFPLRAAIVIIFDEVVDEQSAKDNIVIFGPDKDRIYGPWSVDWIDVKGESDPFFLKSPGFKGDVECTYKFSLLTDANEPYTGSDYDSAAPNYKTKLEISPVKPWAPSTEYTVYIIGNPDGESIYGLSARTFYDPLADAGNGGDGSLLVKGTYTGDTDRQLVIEITEAGAANNCSYKWYFADAPLESTDADGSKKYRKLLDTGLLVKLSGEDLQVGDLFTVDCVVRSYLAESYTSVFTTGTGSIETIPTTTSTSVLGDLNEPASDAFEVLSTTPEHQELKISETLKLIVVNFSNDINAATITDKTVKIEAIPATGYDQNVDTLGKLKKFLYVNGKTLYIVLQRGVE